MGSAAIEKWMVPWPLVWSPKWNDVPPAPQGVNRKSSTAWLASQVPGWGIGVHVPAVAPWMSER